MTDRRTITFEEVERAGRALFGPAFAAEGKAWRAALKTVYRRRAMETHPDRAGALGRTEADLSREFRAVTEAYRFLSGLCAGPIPRAAARPPSDARDPSATAAPPPPSPRADPAPPPSQEAARRSRSSAPPGEMPRRRLRLGEFLYYSGRVRWSELADAIAWQRAQRPPIGRIAVSFGFLDHDDVGVILERRREAGARGTPFGEMAVRLGYLTSFQLLAALGQQYRLQRPIGGFFVERGLLDEEEIEEARGAILRHNVRQRGRPPSP